MPVLTSFFEVKGCVGTLEPFRRSEIYYSQQPMKESFCCVCLCVFEPTASTNSIPAKDWQLWQKGDGRPLHVLVCMCLLHRNTVCQIACDCVTAKVLFNRYALQSAVTEVNYKLCKLPQKHTHLHKHIHTDTQTLTHMHTPECVTKPLMPC